MVFIPNARITITRGTFLSADDDEADSRMPVAIDIAASLVEKTTTVASPETGRSVDVEYVEGFVKSNIDVKKGDRVQDQRTGLVYTVDGRTQSAILGVGDIRLKMRLLEA